MPARRHNTRRHAARRNNARRHAARRRLTLCKSAALLFALLAWLGVSGVQWDAIQLLAFARMTLSYAITDRLDIAQAVAKAVSGEDPCGFCKLAAAGRTTGQAAAPAPAEDNGKSAGKSPGKSPGKDDATAKSPLAQPPSALTIAALAASRLSRAITSAILPASPICEVPTPPPRAA